MRNRIKMLKIEVTLKILLYGSTCSSNMYKCTLVKLFFGKKYFVVFQILTFFCCPYQILVVSEKDMWSQLN